MSETEYISDTEKEHPFVAIGVASFDLLSGIKVCHRWLFSDKENSDISENLEHVFKIALSNVHRQGEQNFEKCATSTIELLNFNYYVTNAIFINSPNSTKRNIYISVGFIFESSKIKNNPHLTETLLLWTKIFSNCVKTKIAKKEQFSTLRKIVERIVFECSNLVSCGISKIPSFTPYPSYRSFYANLLTSHMTTQMTTVIESSSAADAQHIANFLANFLLPYQRELSSLEYRSVPISGLFLQCVERQKLLPDEHMIFFHRPVTWVRLPERQIFRTSPELQPAQIAESFTKLTESVCHENQEVKRQISLLKGQYKTQQVTNPSFWALNTYSLLCHLPKQAHQIICEQQFAEIIRNAVAFVTIANGRKDKSMNQTILKTLLKIPPEDQAMVIAIAQLYDTDLYRRS